jgi:hypothetical protein
VPDRLEAGSKTVMSLVEGSDQQSMPITFGLPSPVSWIFARETVVRGGHPWRCVRS